MAISFQTLLNSRLGVATAMGFGRALSPPVGYRLANFAADQVSRRRSLSIVRTVRLNQWVVTGEQLSGAQLDSAVRDTFRNTVHCLYDLYHNLGDLTSMQRLISFNDEVLETVERSRRAKEAAVIVGVHLSNFDLVLHAAGMIGLSVQVLSAAKPPGGYAWQNELRRKDGLEITPASPATLKMAVDRLRAGGSVLTGIDRPVPVVKYRPRFFGLPAALPTHHIYLAMKTGVPVYVLAAIMDDSGIYCVAASKPVFMRQDGEHHSAIVRNAEAVLEVAEEYIRQAPQQWSMFFPVWPQIQEEFQEYNIQN